jgi:hypothetical protein
VRRSLVSLYANSRSGPLLGWDVRFARLDCFYESLPLVMAQDQLSAWLALGVTQLDVANANQPF